MLPTALTSTNSTFTALLGSSIGHDNDAASGY